MAKILPACLLAAGLSLLLPSEPSYDPWAWLVWGREIPFLDLDTLGGPSWKPLPVAFTVVFAPFGKLNDAIPPALWIVVARAAALLALVLTYRVAARMAGGAGWRRVLAGSVAVVALALTPQWLRYMGHGSEAPMAVALALWGLERHLHGARGQAFALGLLACLLRPEMFLFVGPYALFLWRAEPEHRLRLALGLVLLPLLWILPEWIGSGDPLDAGEQATSEPPWSLSLAQQPWLAALERAHRLAGLPLELGALVAVAFALRARDRIVLGLAGAVAAWLGMFVGMTQLGFSGNARYFLPALVLLCLLAGVGAARLAGQAAREGWPLPAPARAFAMVALLAVLVAPYAERRARGLERQAKEVAEVAALGRDLSHAVRAIGGPNAVTPHGAPTVNRAFETRLAWDLKVAMADVEAGQGRAVVFRTDARISSPKPLPSWFAKRRVLARVGQWRVFESPSFTLFSHSLQGNASATSLLASFGL